MNEIRLTQTVSCGGCASKLNPIDLYSVLDKLPSLQFKDLLVGFETGDDACVYKLSNDVALVFTTDFIAPLVDNPFDFGRAAATNALSDIYAMGGTPLMAINIMCFDSKLDNSVLEQILLGASEVCRLSNTILCGGHTVTATEIRFGLAVIGTVHPNKVITNSKGKPGDILLLTKPLGIGILSQAMKNNLLDDELVTILLGELCTLNDKVAHMMQQEAIECATDVTGFGLAGHLHKLARSSNCGAEIILNEVPILPKAVEFAADDVHSGIIRRNKEFLRDFLVEMNKDSPKSKVLFDPQTSGGILMAVPENKLVEVRKALVHSETKNWIIGRLTTESPGTIKVI